MNPIPSKKSLPNENNQFSQITRDFFFDSDELPKSSTSETPRFLLSTDSLSGYGLDLIFSLVKEAWFDGIDLALWKNFDAWKSDYVKKLIDTYQLPVYTIQTSANLNDKEIRRAIDLCYDLGVDTLAINAPTFFNFKAYNFIVDNILKRRKEHKALHFTLITPEDSSVFALPIPKYRFTSVVEIVKKYLCYIWLDVANLNPEEFEEQFMRKLKDFLPYISTIYLSDVTRTGERHMLPGEGNLKLPTFLKKLKEYGYCRYITIKLSIKKTDLADADKVKLLLHKARAYLKEYYEDIIIS